MSWASAGCGVFHSGTYLRPHLLLICILRLLSWSFFPPQEKWTNKNMSEKVCLLFDFGGCVPFVGLYSYSQVNVCPVSDERPG